MYLYRNGVLPKIVVLPYYVCLPEVISESYCQIHSPFHDFRDHVPDDALHRYDDYAWYSYPRPPYEYTCTPGSDSPGRLPRGYP
ncbi:hypothetical protein BDR03DRAFT_972229 [Suillus americanus]|nr:hypothetical protein BDR03DRAFT_972229 [Suillus americanus]